MPTWNGKESRDEKNARLSKERRKELLEEVNGFLEVVSPIHSLKEHYHGEDSQLDIQDRLDDPDPPEAA